MNRLIRCVVYGLLVITTANVAPASAFLLFREWTGTFTQDGATYTNVWPVNRSYTSGPLIYWSTPQVDAKTVQYYINSNGTSDTAGEFTAVEDGVELWENVSSSSIVMTYQGTTASTNSKTDGKNVFSWDTSWDDLGSNILAYALLTFTTSTGALTDFDVVFNDEDYTWYSSGTDPSVKGVAAHEVGHGIGLAHSDMDYSTMAISNPPTFTTVDYETLEGDDRWGASWLYPVALEAVPKSGKLEVKWADHNYQNTHFRVRWGSSSSFVYSDSVTLGDVTSHTITGLTNGTQYYVTVSEIFDTSTERAGGRSNEVSNLPSACRCNYDDTGSSEGTVDFDDFFLFADHFGDKWSDGGYEQRFDLTGNRSVDYPDTVIFYNDYLHDCPYPASKPLAVANKDNSVGVNTEVTGAARWTVDGGRATLRARIDGTEQLRAFGLSIRFDEEALRVTDVDFTPVGSSILTSSPAPLTIAKTRGNLLSVCSVLPRGGQLASGSGDMVEIVFESKEGTVSELPVVEEVVLIDGAMHRNQVTMATEGESLIAAQAAEITIEPNTPNPFNPSTEIFFSIGALRHPVSLGVYNVSGQLVRSLIYEESMAPGRHRVAWDGIDSEGRVVAAGVYLCALKVDGAIYSQKLLLLK